MLRDIVVLAPPPWARPTAPVLLQPSSTAAGGRSHIWQMHAFYLSIPLEFVRNSYNVWDSA